MMTTYRRPSERCSNCNAGGCIVLWTRAHGNLCVPCFENTKEGEHATPKTITVPDGH
jgi:hypothetical protein